MAPPSMMPGQYAYNGQQGAHRRGQSMSQTNAGPPPAPSSGASGFTEVTHQRRGSQSGHSRRHSLALPEAKRAAEKAQAIKQNSGFAFPGPSSESATNSDYSSSRQTDSSSSQRRNASPQRRGVAGHGRSQSMAGNRMGSTSPVRGSSSSSSGFQFPPPPPQSQVQQAPGLQDSSLGRSSSGGHGRQSSRNFDSNWRAGPPVAPQEPPQPYFTPGHRTRASMSNSVSSLQNFGQNFAYPPTGAGMHGSMSMLQTGGNMMAPQLMGQQAQNPGAQNRKSLFSPYLPQATLPALLSDGRLVAGVLRVNKKNRSDAYVSTDLLDEDIFICGSKDRNRALEGDFVAIELLDVDEVWSAKRDKEDKKKRKDNNSGMSGGGLRRQGSIRDRPEAKKKDDVEVEGQGLLLVDEEEVNDDQKPMYAGHVVAVVERTAGQMFSGTLGLLRPSSAATKEKQDAERRDRDGSSSTSHRQQERPKIVWFKPTDKRVPLIAIPTEQAPRDFVDNHENYKNRIFVACIKRWPITSLHPFGTLIEELGNMGDVSVETEALLRDNSFLAEEFSATVLDAVNQISEEIDIDGEGRKDFRGERAFAIAKEGTKEVTDAFHIRKTDDGYEVGVHVTDANYFVRSGYVLDREAKKRGCAVSLVKRTVPMLPVSLTEGVAAFAIDVDRRAISIVFKISEAFELEDSWIGKSIIRNTAQFSYEQIEDVLSGEAHLEDTEIQADIVALNSVSNCLFDLRYPVGVKDISTLKLFHQLDHEERDPSPVSANIFERKQANTMVDELLIRANITVAELLVEKISGSALLRKQSSSSPKKVEQLVTRAKRLGVEIDSSSMCTILNSIANVEDFAVRKALEIFLVKACNMPKYIIAGNAHHDNNFSHFGYNIPVYTHFTSPFTRYSDLVAHRQLSAALDDQAWSEDAETLGKQADFCNTKKDSAKNAQDQSIHLMLCSMVDKLSATSGAVIRQAIVINVMDSSFDVLLPEFGVEKRVHLDQLPLHKAEFDTKTRKLELFWMKGVDSATWIPADQQGKGTPGHMRGASVMEEQMLQQKMIELSSLTIEDESTLFEDGEIPSSMGTTSKSVPSSPPKRPVPSDARPASSTAVPTLADIGNQKDKPAFSFEMIHRRANGDVVQEITELSRVPVVLQADCIFKSPPLLLVRAINPARE